MTERSHLEQAIAALQAQRASLGDAVVDTALAPLRQRLAWLEGPVPGAPAEQALRQVSVLFLDIVGSTALSQHLDPEDVHAVMDDTLERCTAVVQAHGGRVLQYAGDNLLAAFGAGRVHEDDAERAVACGLALLNEGRALRERVQHDHGHSGCDVRVGVHTGPVLLGGGVDEEGTIRGLTVNVAARMEQTAPPGALRISQHTWLLVRGAFDAQVQPPLVVKGHDDPLLTYLVQRARPRELRAPSRGIEGVLSPMVGRDAEFARLVRLLDEAASTRGVRAATVVGEAGLGKSRLLVELQHEVKRRGRDRVWLLQGRAHPTSHLQPYGLLRDLLAWRLQIADSHSSEQAKARLVDGLRPWLGDDAEAQAHCIGQLVGLDFSASPHVRGLEPRQLRALAFAALTCCLQGLATDGTVVAMLMEDLHWADDGSLDFLAGLVQTGRALPLLLVCTARPELLERRPEWTALGPAHEVLVLAALDRAQGSALAHALLGRTIGGAEALRTLLVERAEGNPFFMEELVRMFIDDGVIVVDGDGWRVHPGRLRQARVPTTLVGVLQARLDALQPADRAALQLASIVGPVFWDDALSSLDRQAPVALPTLRGRALIHARAPSAFEGTQEEAFHHHLLQQVTYDTVLKPVRRAGHAAAAQWLAERVGDRPAEYLAITGEHYERAGDHARALDYFERAAADANRRFASQAAMEYAERALANPAATDLRRRDGLYYVVQCMADLAGLRTKQEQATAEREAIAEQLDDDALRAHVLVDRALLASRRGDETLAFETATRAAALATRAGDIEQAALAIGQTAWSLYSLGDLDRALLQAQQAIDLLRDAMRGEATPSRQLMEVQLLTVRASIEESRGELGRAGATLGEAFALARERGLQRPQAPILEGLGQLEAKAGRFEAALSHLDGCNTVAREIGWTMYVASSGYFVARCRVELGQTQAALALLAESEAEAQRCDNADIQGRCLLLRARLAARAGEPAAAPDLLKQANARFHANNAMAFVCQVSAEMAMCHLVEGRIAEAREEVESIAADLEGGLSLAATDSPLRPWLVCHLVWTSVADPRARAAIERAHAELQAMAARCGDEELRRSMLDNVALHREIDAAWRAAQRA